MNKPSLSRTMRRAASCAILAASSLALVVHAQTAVTDPAAANMQRAMAGIIQQTAAARGVSSSDPRTFATLYGIGKAATSTAAAVGTGVLVAGTAPAWGTLLAAAAVTTAVGYAVSLGIDKAVSWYFDGKPDTVTVKQSAAIAPGAIPDAALLPAGSLFAKTPATPSGWSTVAPADFLTNPVYTNTGDDRFKVPAVLGACSQGDGYTHCWLYGYSTSRQSHGCADGFAWRSVGELCPGQPAYRFYDNGTEKLTPLTTEVATLKPTSQALTSIPASTLASPVDHASMALIANDLWKKAAADPAYTGVPYSATQPITAAEVKTWATANPASYPTVAGLVAPLANPAADLMPQPAAQPSGSALPTGSTTTTGTDQTATKVDLGPDPGITPPGLEAPPTALAIFKPFLDLVAPLLNINFNLPPGECPRPTFEVFGKQIVMQSHCEIAEQQRQALTTVMNAVFMVAAILIIFSA